MGKGLQHHRLVYGHSVHRYRAGEGAPEHEMCQKKLGELRSFSLRKRWLMGTLLLSSPAQKEQVEQEESGFSDKFLELRANRCNVHHGEYG